MSRWWNEFPLSIYTTAVYQQLHLKATDLNQNKSDAKRGEIWLAHARASAAAVWAEDCAVTSCDRSGAGSRGGRATAPVLPPSWICAFSATFWTTQFNFSAELTQVISFSTFWIVILHFYYFPPSNKTVTQNRETIQARYVFLPLLSTSSVLSLVDLVSQLSMLNKKHSAAVCIILTYRA